jgi:peptidoglycan/LPS O-acetylase OafA/YrhL
MSEQGKIKSPGGYLSSLDGYRGIGTWFVILHHVPFIFIRTPFGYFWWVLQSFFVLSGFLLTRILIKEKEKGYPFFKYAKTFLLRRFYRIFPLYWAFLAFFGILLLLFGITKIPLYADLMQEYKQNWIWLWTYTYNFKELINTLQGLNCNISPFFSHLWSLSVEEQFYVILPFLVYFLSMKNLKRVILAIIILSPLIRLGTYFIFHDLAFSAEYAEYFKDDDHLRESWLTVIILRSTWTNFDCFAFGMALAVWDFKWIKNPKVLFYWVFVIFVAIVTINGLVYARSIDLEAMMANPYFPYKKAVEILPAAITKLYVALSDHHSLLINFQFVYMYTIVNTLSFLIVLSCIRDQPILNIFRNEKVIYTGKITYGVYLFHYPLLMFVILFLGPIFIKVNNKFGQLPFELSMLAVYLPLLWILSHWSYKYFETYFMKLKDRVK